VELIAELGSGPREVSRARRALARALAAWGWTGDAVDIAVLLTSELVTNAIRHGAAPVRLSAGLLHLAVLRVEVHDSTPAAGGDDEVAVRHAADDDEGGRGLHLVDVLADTWGWRPADTGGKRVWFELGPRHG
jgi:anti-sigma regulatory factor (Ser/Thr protein kinase)